MTGRVRHSALLLSLAAATTLLGCDSLLGPRDNSILRDQLARGEARWQEAAIVNYDVGVTRGPLHADGHVSVILYVRNGVIAGAVYRDTGEDVEPHVLATHQTVPELFDLVRDALDRRVPGIAVSYDQEYGFPREIIVDYDAFRIDDDLYIALTELTEID